MKHSILFLCFLNYLFPFCYSFRTSRCNHDELLKADIVYLNCMGQYKVTDYITALCTWVDLVYIGCPELGYGDCFSSVEMREFKDMGIYFWMVAVNKTVPSIYEFMATNCINVKEFLESKRDGKRFNFASDSCERDQMRKLINKKNLCLENIDDETEPIIAQLSSNQNKNHLTQKICEILHQGLNDCIVDNYGPCLNDIEQKSITDNVLKSWKDNFAATNHSHLNTDCSVFGGPFGGSSKARATPGLVMLILMIACFGMMP